MSLENLNKIGKVKAHECSADEGRKLLAAARRNLKETQIQELSSETRFDLAYKAIMQSSLLALMCNGYRPSTSEPGHHATVIRTLPTTIGLANDRMVILDKLRRTRNVSDYSGDGVSEEEAASCVRSARALLASLEEWLKIHKQDWLAAAAQRR